MRSPPGELVRQLRGWLVPAALLALAPKCVLCVLAYAGLGTALGLGGPEICEAAAPGRPWAAGLPMVGLMLVVALAFTRRCRALKRAPVHSAGSTSSSSTSKIRPDSGGTLPACMLP